jgi:hypothetical protein
VTIDRPSMLDLQLQLHILIGEFLDLLLQLERLLLLVTLRLLSLGDVIEKKGEHTLNQMRLLLDQFSILNRGGVVLESQETPNFEETQLY